MSNPPNQTSGSDSNFLQLIETFDEPTRLAIEKVCALVTLEPGQFVYLQGAPADAVYIVVSGVAEAITFSPDGKQSRSLGRIPRGDFFGDLALLTDNPRLAAVRILEAAELLRIKKEGFLKLMQTIPQLGYFFSRNLARRLHGTSTEAHHRVYDIDLTGNLQRFDLLTIVQAITGMAHTGELSLNNSANELLGSFFFRNGRVEFARFGHLLGLEAIWQGFIESASEGTFSFRSIEQPTQPFAREHKIDMDSTSLLLEGVGKRDTYQGMPETLRHMEGSLTRVAPSLDWKNDDTRLLAGLVWELLTEPQPLQKIWKKLNYSAISFLEVVMEMGMNGQAELFIEESKIKEKI
jgi:CRP-like cAMP-binding protein